MKMKQIIMVGPRQSKIFMVDIPTIGEKQLLVRVTYTGMCHSELYPWMTAKDGDVFGHEAVGVVEKVGSKVTAFKCGDRVSGLGGGAYREFIVMEEEKTCLVPDNLEDVDAIAEPLACLLSTAVKMPLVTLGDSIAVVGTGYMGLGMVSLFKAMGYGDIIAVDKREEALENAKKFGATECYTPETLPREYILDWENVGKVDLKRDGHFADIFGLGFQNVMEFTGTQDGLNLAGEMVCAHGNLGIGGFHNDGDRTIDYKLWNFKAMNTLNCHERRIMYEFGLCKRSLELLSRGIWKFTGVTNHIYTMEEFDLANQEMEAHTNGFIKGAVKCS